MVDRLPEILKDISCTLPYTLSESLRPMSNMNQHFNRDAESWVETTMGVESEESGRIGSLLSHD